MRLRWAVGMLAACVSALASAQVDPLTLTVTWRPTPEDAPAGRTYRRHRRGGDAQQRAPVKRQAKRDEQEPAHASGQVVEEGGRGGRREPGPSGEADPDRPAAEPQGRDRHVDRLGLQTEQRQAPRRLGRLVGRGRLQKAPPAVSGDMVPEPEQGNDREHHRMEVEHPPDRAGDLVPEDDHQHRQQRERQKANERSHQNAPTMSQQRRAPHTAAATSSRTTPAPPRQERSMTQAGQGLSTSSRRNTANASNSWTGS